MVMRMKVAIGFGLEKRQQYIFDLVFPHLLVTSTSAAGMWRAMHTANISSLLAGLDILMAKSQRAIEIDETDCLGGALESEVERKG